MAERGSVFAKLVGSMLAMAISLIVLVTAFFWFAVGPHLNAVVYRLAESYSMAVAATAPSLADATAIASRLDVQVRFEGPSGGWATAPWVPSVDDVRSGRAPDSHILLRPKYYLAPGPNGGTYLFRWSFGQRLHEAHIQLLVLLLLVMVAIVFTTHAVLRRLLRPLRVLNDGVARLAAGELDVTLPNVSRDEFGRLTTAFNEMVHRVREMIRARDQLLIDVSHELRSPLTRMKVALELPAGGDLPARFGPDVAEMERMVSELLELERLRSGSGVHASRQDLMPIVWELAEAFRDRAPGVRVLATVREAVVEIDAEKVRTVLRNLLENAVKYSRPQSRPVEIVVEDDPEWVTVRVTDDGVGIPASEVDRVFEPFFRVDASRSKQTGGYGLGLSICKRVMEAHGGSIAVETAAGGTSFVLKFPRHASLAPDRRGSRLPTGVDESP